MFSRKAHRITELEQVVAGLQAQLGQANGHLAAIGGLEHAEVRAQVELMRAETARIGQSHVLERQRHQSELAAARAAVHAQLDEVRRQVAQAHRELVPITDELVFQQAGVFRYHHPLENAEAYEARLAQVNTAMKQMIKDRQAVEADSNFTFNGSRVEGARMVNDWCKVMLRAYNAEAENCLRVMKAGSVQTAKTRLDRTAEAIGKLGRMLNIRIARRYQDLRRQELELTADYLRKKQEEKEAERAARARLREEAKAQAEFRREIEKLDKERNHLVNVRQALLDKGDEAAARKIQVELDDVDAGLQGLRDREANIRAGYVYVISNVGALGANMVKIGLTRRLKPEERVLELGDASVPFRYDTHIIFFSHDAVTLESALHRELSDRRVNKVNTRREFFHATPGEVLELLKKHAGEVLEYVVEPEALEYRQSGERPDGAPALPVPLAVAG
ncbi:DUF4041 domain-containing protein [Actinosynnema sp. NPDC023658]|uniref:DUF4041 domain-containing protein n=1 Tax=Actinosynnema sp. NPDC023658 TaxID=3155465 RepID=UPI0033F8772C